MIRVAAIILALTVSASARDISTDAQIARWADQERLEAARSRHDAIMNWYRCGGPCGRSVTVHRHPQVWSGIVRTPSGYNAWRRVRW